MTTRGSSRLPNRLHHSSSRDSRRAWDGVPPPPSTILSGGFEVALSGIKIGFTNLGSGIGDDLRLRYRPEAECISFEGPNARGMLVPLEEMLLKDNLDGTISVFFRRQFRRKYYTLEGSSSRVCDHIQAFKNELNQELHMLCYVTGYDPLTSAANFVRRVKHGRQNIPLNQHTSEFPTYTSYRHPQPQFNIPADDRDFHTSGGRFDEPPPAQYRRNSYYPEPEMAERYPGAAAIGRSAEGPRVRFRDHPPPPVPQPPSMPSRGALRGGAGPTPEQFREYESGEQYMRGSRDPRNMRNGSADRSEDFFRDKDPRGTRSSRTPMEDMNGFEPPAPPRVPTPAPREPRDPRYSRSQSTVNIDRPGQFDPPLPPPTPQPQKRMFALVFKKSPIDQGVEIRPASIDSSHEVLMRQASTHWNLRELRLYGHVDGLKMNLNTQSDLEAYVKLCDGMQRLMVDVE